MPQQVRNYLENIVGAWDLDSKTLKARVVFAWDPGKTFIIGNAQGQMGDRPFSDAAFWHWDGVSENGIIISWVAPDIHSTTRCKIMSKTLLEGKERGTQFGKRLTSNFHATLRGPDRFAFIVTQATVGGERQPDWTGVFTRIKGTCDEQELINRQHEWSRATVKRDGTSLERLLADEYVLTTSEGTFLSKAQMISELQSDDFGITSMAIDNCKVQIYGSTAVVKGRVRWADGSDKNGQNLFTETWLKRDGRWQCIATHESEMAQPGLALQKLEGFVGDWTYQGEQVDPGVDIALPFAEDGTYSGKFTARFVLDGAFLETKWQDMEGPSGKMSGMYMTGYDANTKTYTQNARISDGTTSVRTATLDGRIWTSHSTMTTPKGEKVLVKEVVKYARDWGSYTSTVQLSVDNGKTWKHWWKERGKKGAASDTLEEMNKDVVRRVMVEIPIDDWEAVRELHAPDFVYHGPDPSKTMTREELGQEIKMFHAAFPDLSRTIEDMVAVGDKVVVRLSFRGTHQGEYQGIPATGKKTLSEGVVILRMADGKIAEAWEQYDELSFRQQLVSGSSATDRQELIRLDNVWFDAMRRGDAAPIERMLANDFTLIAPDPDGTILTRSDYLEFIESGDLQLTSIAIDSLDVQIYGNTAVLTATLTSKGRVNNNDIGGQYRGTTTWIKRDGRWQCVAAHDTKLAQEDETERNKATLRRIFEEVINNPNWDAYEDIYHKDFVFHGPNGRDVKGIRQFWNDIKFVRSIFPDYRETEVETVAQGDFVASRWISTGTHKKNGKKFEMSNMTLHRFEDGKVSDVWFFCDRDTQKKQLGLEKIF